MNFPRENKTNRLNTFWFTLKPFKKNTLVKESEPYPTVQC